MGHKVNPIIFRSGSDLFETSVWSTGDSSYSHLLIQDFEIKNFLDNLVKSQGIFLRSSKLIRSSNKLTVYLDLYFSFLLTKQMTFLGVRSLFKSLKNENASLIKLKDLKDFQKLITNDDINGLKNSVIAQTNQKYLSSFRKRGKLFVTKKKFLNIFRHRTLMYKESFYFFLFLKENKNIFLYSNELGLDLNSYQIFRRHFDLKAKHICFSFSKFKKLFSIKRFRYNFRTLLLKNIFLHRSKALDSFNFIFLNKKICQSLYNFTGIENIELKIMSSQLRYMPIYKCYRKFLTDDLKKFQ